MIYKESNQPFCDEVFKNPPCAYRAAPFWAWNNKLDTEEVIRQTTVFKQMGFGGYFMHVRTGLDTPYLGEDFNKNIRACVESSRKQDMLAWLYDEDRWPSGFAGGLVTKNKAYRQRILRFTQKEYTEKPLWDERGRLLSGRKLLARYNIHKFCGKILSYTRLKEDEPACGRTWYAYLEVTAENSWYNNQTYVDTLNPEAMEKFADITYGSYAKNIPDALGNVSPAIFTDEPQFHDCNVGGLSIFSFFHIRAWTDDFEITYKKAYGEDVFDTLPEVIFESDNKLPKYRYWDHVSERFCTAFSDTLGRRAKEVNLELTGHVMQEASLLSAERSVGDCIRQYRGFGIPGIDMLCSRYEFTTAKQCQSAVHQYGREGMLSELYGVSRWNYEFRDYKIHGDWQAALGVTLRVPHLSMMSMKGEAKRDYPASISYQSPWYKKFSLVEDHFGRVATALTGGKPVVEIAMVYPIESMWIKDGVKERTASKYKLDKNYRDIVEWMLKGGLDFDLIDEALLPELCREGGYPLRVGQMQYKAVVVPACVTLRKTTLDRLEKFQKEGGKVFFVGKKPSLTDAVPPTHPNEFIASAPLISFRKEEILRALERYRVVAFVDRKTGVQTDNLIYNLRERDGGLWLFVCHAYKDRFVDNNQIKREEITLRVRGEYVATLYDTVTGEIIPLACQNKDGWTYIDRDIYNQDSLLIRLEKGKSTEGKTQERERMDGTVLTSGVSYRLDEPNVLVLDHARFALDTEKYSLVPYDILALDNKCRKKCGFKPHGGSICQPWAQEKKKATHKLRLLFTVRSSIDYEGAELALEDADKAVILWNGKEIEKKITGWYVDLSIQKVALPKIEKGKNRLEIILPFGENTDTENCFILGRFGVSLLGSKGTIGKLPETLDFTDITKQGLPFYGGKLTYITTFEGNGKDCLLQIPAFRLPVLSARCNGAEKDIAYAPYTCVLPTVMGKNVLEIDGYVSRQNSFGTLHNPATRSKDYCIGPGNFRSANVWQRTRRYMLVETGIIQNPVLYR